MIGKRDRREPSFSSELEHGISRLKKLNLGSEPIPRRRTTNGGGAGRMVSGRRENLIVEFHTGTEEKNVEIVVKGIKEKKKTVKEVQDVKKKREMKEEEKREKSPSPVPTIRTLLAPAMATIVEIEEDNGDEEVTSASSSSREVQKLKFSRLHIC